jgi:hypothetical protein
LPISVISLAILSLEFLPLPIPTKLQGSILRGMINMEKKVMMVIMLKLVSVVEVLKYKMYITNDTEEISTDVICQAQTQKASSSLLYVRFWNYYSLIFSIFL